MLKILFSNTFDKCFSSFADKLVFKTKSIFIIIAILPGFGFQMNKSVFILPKSLL